MKKALLGEMDSVRLLATLYPAIATLGKALSKYLRGRMFVRVAGSELEKEDGAMFVWLFLSLSALSAGCGLVPAETPHACRVFGYPQVIFTTGAPFSGI